MARRRARRIRSRRVKSRYGKRRGLTSLLPESISGNGPPQIRRAVRLSYNGPFNLLAFLFFHKASSKNDRNAGVEGRKAIHEICASTNSEFYDHEGQFRRIAVEETARFVMVGRCNNLIPTSAKC